MGIGLLDDVPIAGDEDSWVDINNSKVGLHKKVLATDLGMTCLNH